MSQQTMLKEYIRNEDTKQPRGVVVAVRVDDEVFYGYSLLNVKLDRFNKTLGLQIAVNRAMAESYVLPNTPEREAMVLDALSRVEKRALKYFKDLDPSKISLVNSEESGGKFTVA
jgi:uncharacterized protein YebE (UPF0316 family)